MKKLTLGLALLVSATFVFSSCNGNTTANASGTPTEASTPAAPKVSEADLKAFLHSKEGTYGWETKSDDISYDFFVDGRLAIQGPDGESTMWEGTWTVKGDQVHLVCADRNQDETLTAKIDGEKLVLGNKVYTRYQPQ